MQCSHIKDDGNRCKAATLQSSSFYEANLKSANLDDANLKNAIMAYAYMNNVHMVFANLENAIFIGANMVNANLMNANLKKADLTHANLKYANLLAASLDSIDFSKVKSITVKQLSQAKSLRGSTFKPALHDSLLKMYPHLFEPPDSTRSKREYPFY